MVSRPCSCSRARSNQSSHHSSFGTNSDRQTSNATCIRAGGVAASIPGSHTSLHANRSSLQLRRSTGRDHFVCNMCMASSSIMSFRSFILAVAPGNRVGRRRDRPSFNCMNLPFCHSEQREEVARRYQPCLLPSFVKPRRCHAISSGHSFLTVIPAAAPEQGRRSCGGSCSHSPFLAIPIVGNARCWHARIGPWAPPRLYSGWNLAMLLAQEQLPPCGLRPYSE